MPIHDPSQSDSPASTIEAQVVTAAVNGATVDLAGFDAAVVHMNIGAQGGTTASTTLQIQDSPDGTTWTAVPATELEPAVALPVIATGTTDAQLIKRAYMGLQRYLRVAVTAVAGTSPSLPMSATIHRSEPYDSPVAATE